MISIQAFVYTSIGCLLLGFGIGRFVFLMKNGQLITSVVKQRTVYAQNFKANSVYRAMASQLEKDGFVVVKDVKDLDKLKSKIAKAANLSVESLETENRGGRNFKISKKQNNG